MIDTDDVRTLAVYTVLAVTVGAGVLFGAAVLAVAVRLFLSLSGV